MTKKVNILFLHAGAELYGSDRILFSVVTNLDKTVFNPIVVLPNNGPLVKKLRLKGINVEVVPYPILRRKYFNLIGIVKFIMEYRGACNRLVEIVQKNNIEIIHNNTIAVLEGITLKKRCGVILVSHVHEMLDKPRLVARFLYGKHLKYANEILCVSNAVKKHIEKQVGCSEKLVVVHNGAIPIIRKKNDLKKKIGVPVAAYLFAIIGRINAIKGQGDFIEAIRRARKENNNIYGLIVGSAFAGQEWRVNEMLKKISNEKMDDYIKYVGFMDEIEDVYSSIDALILPSVQYDSFPTVVLEAMSCGVPTIAYKCGGVEEMIDNKINGYLVDMNDIDGLSEKMIQITGDDFRASAFKIFSERFRLETFINNIQSEYKKVAKDRK